MNRSSEGYALVGVLVFSLLIMPLIALFAQSARVAAKSTVTVNNSFKLSLLAEGLGLAAATRLSHDRAFLERYSGLKPFSCSEEGAAFTFIVQDHDGKVSLNSAEGKLLGAGFRAAGLNSAQSGAMQKFVETSRQQSSAAVNLPEFGNLPLKFAPFERVEELNDALAALKAPPVDLTRFFTVLKNNANIELESADPALKAIIESEPVLRSEAVAKDNDSFEAIDLRIVVRERADARPRLYSVQTFSRTKSGVVPAGAKKAAASEQNVTVGKGPISSCETVLGLSGGADA